MVMEEEKKSMSENVYTTPSPQLAREVAAIIEDMPYQVANLANISAHIFAEVSGLNWAGFYLMRDGKLVLGPFQGKVACFEIAIGKGVCGTAVKKDATMVVDNVHEFDGHIACDSESNSEIVVPIHCNGEVVGVLDIDSTEYSRFGEKEKLEMEAVVKVIEDNYGSWR